MYLKFQQNVNTVDVCLYADCYCLTVYYAMIQDLPFWNLNKWMLYKECKIHANTYSSLEKCNLRRMGAYSAVCVFLDVPLASCWALTLLRSVSNAM